MIEFARRGRLSCRPLAPDTTLGDQRLTDGQRQAIRHVWTSPDRVMVVRGGAGTGKTTLMQTAVAGITSRPVAVFAPTSAARDVLRAEGFSTAETLQRLLIDDKLQATLANSVLWIDEAGLISVPQMASLFELADKLDARIILSGDPGQHSSVTRGDALRLIEDRAGIRPAAVTEIVRQRGDYKRAVEAIAAGDVARGWSQLERLGAIIEIAGDDRIATLASDYAKETKSGRSVLVVSPTHAEKDKVTAAIRDALKRDDRLGEEKTFTVLHDLAWTAAEKSDPLQYRPGQWVKITQNLAGFTRGEKLQVSSVTSERVAVKDSDGNERALPLSSSASFKVYSATEKPFAVGDLVRITENGETATGRFVNGAIHRVSQFTAGGDIRLDNGKTLPRDYGNFDHGYASTSHGSQGRTVDTVLVAMGRASLVATSLEQFYVTVSRGRDAVRLYTDDRVLLREAITHSGQRGSASELVDLKLTRKLKPLRQPETSRKDRLADYTETVARHLKRAAAKAVEALPDRDLRSLAKSATIAEYQGRVASNELER